MSIPRAELVVAGLGPAGPELLPDAARDALSSARRCFFRTMRHPSAAAASALAQCEVESFDDLYEQEESFDEVYSKVVETLVEKAVGPGPVVYAVPGSPFVAERTVEMLRADPRVHVRVVPALSFLDLAWDRLGIDPMNAGVRLVDGTRFAIEAAGERGPLLVGQCWDRGVLSAVKLSRDDPGADRAACACEPRCILLHHLGLPDEAVVPVAWSELDRCRSFEPDHLTSLWVAELSPPIASESMRLWELVRVLRARCPWDMRQTHASLSRHLLEETYETLDAIQRLSEAGPEPSAQDVAHLEEELGDLLVQIYFHCVLGAEEGYFTLADVASAVHDKLVGRHPHVFADAPARTAEDVARRWEEIKREEKGRTSIFDGIPPSLPALALASKIERKTQTIMSSGLGAEASRELSRDLASLSRRVGDLCHRLDASGAADVSSDVLEPGTDAECDLGEILFDLVGLAGRLGVDPETALRAAANRVRRRAEQFEATIRPSSLG